MAYDQDEGQPQPDQQDQVPGGAASPALQAFRGVFTAPGAQQWADEAATRLNDYFQRRRIATENSAAGQNFVQDLSGFRQGLVDMVQADPHAVHVALDLVPHSVDALISTMPSMPEDALGHHAAITRDIQREIAHSAVTALAERDDGQARALLDNERLGAVLSDDAKQALGSYISMQSVARAMDGKAQQDAAVANRQRVADQSALNYLRALHDPQTDGVQFPPGWNQGVIADNALPPGHTGEVTAAYSRLRVDGDATQSDPFLVSRLLNGAGSPTEVIGHVGGDLRLADALHLGELLKPENAGHREVLNAALQQGEQVLAAPANGRAGEEAYRRYVNWVLPAARAGAVLDPGSNDYALAGNRLQLFAPRPEDHVPPPRVSERPVGAHFGVRG